METRANFAMIGAFTLAVIAGAFLFVLWFSGGSKTATRKSFEVIFNGSVSGLSRGSQVLFNGLRVGEVTAIDLLERDPSRVSATIEVNVRTPVKTDTRARLEFQGLTGVASIALTGGSFTAGALSPVTSGEFPLIYADRSDLQNLLETVQSLATKADGVLANIDRVFGENAASITSTVHNVEKFSQALANNSDGINTFLASMADLGQKIGPLAAKLEVLSGDLDNLVKAVDTEKVKGIVADVRTFSGTLAKNDANITALLSDAAGVAKQLNATAARVDAVFTGMQDIVRGIDPKKVAALIDNATGFSATLEKNRGNVDSILKDAHEMTAKLNKSADQLDGILKSVNGFLGSDNSKGMFGDVAEAARSVRKLADNLDIRTKDLAAGLGRFTGPGLREYEALASDGRRTLNDLNRAVRSLERNPQQFIFGGKPAIPEYNAR